jgi:hypothetical protein
MPGTGWVGVVKVVNAMVVVSLYVHLGTIEKGREEIAGRQNREMHHCALLLAVLLVLVPQPAKSFLALLVVVG